MTTFHSLKVARVEPETRDAVTITFAIPQAPAGGILFSPGPASDAKSPSGRRRTAPLLLHLSQPHAGRN